MVRSLVALVFRRVLAWLVWSNEHAKDLEIVVVAVRKLIGTAHAAATLPARLGTYCHGGLGSTSDRQNPGGRGAEPLSLPERKTSTTTTSRT
jgi:hypothetical protein